MKHVFIFFKFIIVVSIDICIFRLIYYFIVLFDCLPYDVSIISYMMLTVY